LQKEKRKRKKKMGKKKKKQKKERIRNVRTYKKFKRNVFYFSKQTHLEYIDPNTIKYKAILQPPAGSANPHIRGGRWRQSKILPSNANFILEDGLANSKHSTCFYFKDNTHKHHSFDKINEFFDEEPTLTKMNYLKKPLINVRHDLKMDNYNTKESYFVDTIPNEFDKQYIENELSSKKDIHYGIWISKNKDFLSRNFERNGKVEIETTITKHYDTLIFYNGLSFYTSDQTQLEFDDHLLCKKYVVDIMEKKFDTNAFYEFCLKNIKGNKEKLKSFFVVFKKCKQPSFQFLIKNKKLVEFLVRYLHLYALYPFVGYGTYELFVDVLFYKFFQIPFSFDKQNKKDLMQKHFSKKAIEICNTVKKK
jgi:hypothetical protein